jgi:hypothetical protein
MIVAVVGVRVVRVRMGNGIVPMAMHVAHARCNGLFMDVMVMRIMHMLVSVFQRLVRVEVLVPLGEMQPDSPSH